jgi:hypothetical protein
MMTATRAHDEREVSERVTFLLEVFALRCECRAHLWAAGEYDLHAAVDTLQADAERDGLVDLLGQDEVQQILATAFGAVRSDEPEHVPDDAMPNDSDDSGGGGRLARSTCDTAEFLVARNDAAQFEEWLGKHSEAERVAIVAHIERRRTP